MSLQKCSGTTFECSCYKIVLMASQKCVRTSFIYSDYKVVLMLNKSVLELYFYVVVMR